MGETRRRFHDELAALESEILGLGERAERAISDAMEALAHKDVEKADAVIENDDALDATYLDIEQRVLHLFATQTPVAFDLRLILAALHSNVHLERVGDIAVNIAKIVKVTIQQPVSATVLTHLQEMAEVVGQMLRTAMEAFARRDADLAERLPEMDEPVDRLNRNMYREVARLAGDPELLEWGILMNIVSRLLERVGDHAVDIGEQVAFILTGEFREFTDASHPAVGEPAASAPG